LAISVISRSRSTMSVGASQNAAWMYSVCTPTDAMRSMSLTSSPGLLFV